LSTENGLAPGAGRATANGQADVRHPELM